MRGEVFTATELSVLEALATYRFLTAAQLHRLGAAKHMRHLYQTLRTLAGRRPAPVGRLDFGSLPGRGRLPVVFFPTRHGAEALAEARREDTPPPVPERVRAFGNDYDHRIECVDVHIALRQWAGRNGATVDLFDAYFDHGRKEAGRPVARTRVALRDGAIVPDAVFKLTTHDGKVRLCALELSSGRETARIERQLAAYRYALHEEAIERTYGYEHAVRVLCVFEYEGTLERVRERFGRRPDFEPFRPYFLLKTLPEVQTDFRDGWRQVGTRGRVPLFAP